MNSFLLLQMQNAPERFGGVKYQMLVIKALSCEDGAKITNILIRGQLLLKI